MINIQFLLAVSGLTIVVVKSKLFKNLRVYFTELYKKKPKNKAIWFIDSVLTCYMCFPFWGGLILYPFRGVEVVMLVFNGVIATTLIVDLWQYICRR